MDRRSFFFSAICTCAACGGAKAQGFNIGTTRFESREAFTEQGLRCGTPLPSLYEQRRGERASAGLRGRNLSTGPTLSIPCNFNIIHDGSKGKLLPKRIDDQIAVLNKAYESANISFTTANVRYHNNAAWHVMPYRSPKEREMKLQLVSNPSLFLNIYTVQTNMLGWATFPWWLEFIPEMDGVILLYNSFPGVTESPYNLGMTAIHEIGHWLGLFHTFQGGCAQPGDSIEDTQAEANPASGCPVGRNSCNAPGAKDPIENFMDYSDDKCMSGFSGGQIRRMREMTGIFRTDLFQASLGRSFSGSGNQRLVSAMKQIREESR